MELNGVKEIIKKQVDNNKIYNFGKAFDTVQKVYYSTNENINGYMTLFDLNNKDVLTVMASGDHAFNACFNNCLNIDTFDTNILTKYYALGIKRSAILAFNYYDYLEFLKKLVSTDLSIDELDSLFKKIYPYMDKEDKLFWKEIFDYNYLLQKNKQDPLNLFRMLLINISNTDEDIFKNSYLCNEENYNELRNKLGKTNIYFYNIECLELSKKLTKKYDLIFLSNICDYFYKNFGLYWKYDNLKNVEDSFSKILNKNGILFINYLYNFYSCVSNIYHSTIANCSSVTLDNLTLEEYYTFDSVKVNNIKDGILVKRKI